MVRMKPTKISAIYLYILIIFVSFVSSLDNNDIKPKEKRILNIVYGSLMIAVGPLFLFLGYRAYRVTLSICGFITITTIIYFTLIAYINIKWWIILLIASLNGLLVGLLIFFLWTVGIFVIGFSFGGVIAVLLLSTPLGTRLISQLYAHILFVVVPGTLLGIISLIFQRMLIIISSSALGSFLIISGIDLIWKLDAGFSGIVPCLFRDCGYFDFVVYSWKYYVLLSSIFVLSIIAILLQHFIICKKYYHNVAQKGYVTIQ